ncbi:helix-turn-helix domain-containing protein [Pseudonocardia sp. HH130629-09]|uniref:helix-turn-helix domain-containing protein n=1 Tax=Pseudonocardia sp. HH130629-09 TaxID=1641402 RepID=UPI0006CB36F6|nr:helix-turn-helix domain-containing protein [Pseudonocardia sp. HH130629-09]ALE83950.1 excisionase [Pseudonocardia sp. HH130629-09]
MPEFTAETLPARQLYRVSEAMLLLSLSRSVIYELIRSGRLGSVTEGRTRLIPATAISRYVDLLTTEAKEADYGQSA